jgi:hypothetical protein
MGLDEGDGPVAELPMAGQVLEACRDASVSPQLRTARPARAPASREPGQQAARQHGVSEGTGQGRALLLLLIILREHTRFTPPWRPKGLLLASAYAMSALPSTRPHPLSIIHPSSRRPRRCSPIRFCRALSPGERVGWDGWDHGWQRREIDTILRLFLALLPPRYRRLVSPPLAARRLTATITHACHTYLPCHTCHMPCHSPSSSFAHTRTARRLLIPPNAFVNAHPNASPALISRWPLTAVARSLAHLGRPRLAWCPRRPRPRPFLPHSPPSAFRVFAALQLRTSLTRPPTHCPLPVTHYTLHITHYTLHIIAYVASR